jgi:hypothetical protein
MKKSLPTTTNTCRLGRRGVITPLHYLTRKETTMTNENLLEEIIFDLVNLEPFWLGVNDDDEDTAFKVKELRAKYRRYLSNVE